MTDAHNILMSKLNCHLRLTILRLVALVMMTLGAVVLCADTCGSRHIMRYVSDVELDGGARLLQISRYQALLRTRVSLSSALVSSARTYWLTAVLTFSIDASIILSGLVADNLMLELHKVARLWCSWHLLELLVKMVISGESLRSTSDLLRSSWGDSNRFDSGRALYLRSRCLGCVTFQVVVFFIVIVYRAFLFEPSRN